MRTPSIMPNDAQRETYIKLDNFVGRPVSLGARPTPKALISDLLDV
jgi:hypothetical protein